MIERHRFFSDFSSPWKDSFHPLEKKKVSRDFISSIPRNFPFIKYKEKHVIQIERGRIFKREYIEENRYCLFNIFFV